MAIKAVFFDIGNVLLDFDAAAIAKRLAWAVSRHPFKVARFLWSSKLGESVERGEMSPRALFALFRRELGFRGTFDDFRSLWCDHFTLNRATVEILAEVAKNSRVYLLSNTNALHYEFIRKRYEFPRQVDGAILSYRVKMRKPEAGIYLAAMRRARVAPREAVFIDDLAENVEGARKTGMRALRFTGAEALRGDLAALGLL